MVVAAGVNATATVTTVLQHDVASPDGPLCLREGGFSHHPNEGKEANDRAP
jgi:hypothetical protein